MTKGKNIRELIRPPLRSLGISHLMVAPLILMLISALNSWADQYDLLRTNWQDYLLTNAGSASSVASTANGYWSSMDVSAGRTYLWSYLPLGSTSANLTTTFQ